MRRTFLERIGDQAQRRPRRGDDPATQKYTQGQRRGEPATDEKEARGHDAAGLRPLFLGEQAVVVHVLIKGPDAPLEGRIDCFSHHRLGLDSLSLPQAHQRRLDRREILPPRRTHLGKQASLLVVEQQ